MRISEWSSDVCSSDLLRVQMREFGREAGEILRLGRAAGRIGLRIEIDDQRRALHRGNVDRRAVGVEKLHLGKRVADRERSAEDRVGKEGGSTVRYRWSPAH